MEGKNFPNDVMYYYQISKAATMSGNSNYYKEIIFHNGAFELYL